LALLGRKATPIATHRSEVCALRTKDDGKRNRKFGG
jgi:hypothetical protein